MIHARPPPLGCNAGELPESYQGARNLRPAVAEQADPREIILPRDRLPLHQDPHVPEHVLDRCDDAYALCRDKLTGERSIVGRDMRERLSIIGGKASNALCAVHADALEPRADDLLLRNRRRVGGEALSAAHQLIGGRLSAAIDAPGLCSNAGAPLAFARVEHRTPLILKRRRHFAMARDQVAHRPLDCTRRACRIEHLVEKRPIAFGYTGHHCHLMCYAP